MEYTEGYLAELTGIQIIRYNSFTIIKVKVRMPAIRLMLLQIYCCVFG